MSLLLPDTGLLFWMCLSFGIVLFVLIKFGFPVIIKMIATRKEFIDSSMESARKANLQLAEIQIQGEAILNQAREERGEMLSDALESKKQIIEEAKQVAISETRQQMERAKIEIAGEKERAIREIRSEIASISIRMTERIVREKLSDTEEQTKVINRMLSEINLQKPQDN